MNSFSFLMFARIQCLTMLWSTDVNVLGIFSAVFVSVVISL